MDRVLTHLDASGNAGMVDVSAKEATVRMATAGCEVRMQPLTLQLIRSGGLKKGDALTVAKVAGIQAAKRTSELIPMCHPLALEHIEIRFEDLPRSEGLRIESCVRLTGKTGVEMEALTAVSIAALTVYDMAKSCDPKMVITAIHLIEKKGGKSDFADSNRHFECQ